MPLIRWFDNIPTGEETPDPPLPSLWLSCLLAVLIGQALQDFGVRRVWPGRSGMFIEVDLIALAIGLPVLLMIYRPTAIRARQQGTFGVVQAVVVAVVILLFSNLAVFFVLFVLVLGPSGWAVAPSLAGYLLMSLNIALTYGVPLGLHYWLRLARIYPVIHRVPLAPPTEGRWLWPATLLLLGLWQVALWQALMA